MKLLDYEIELALVFRRPISSAVTVTRETLPDYVFAITIANDLSARDVQLPQTQFFKGKSYRGFCPIGPWLTVLERDEFPRIDDLALELDVNGAPRQRDTTANLVFKPAETISELSTFANIVPGDVLLTGTPNGCALRVPPPPVRRLLQVLPERVLWKLFLNGQARRPQYLKPGDRITARIRSRDGAVDLGEQATEIVGPVSWMRDLSLDGAAANPPPRLRGLPGQAGSRGVRLSRQARQHRLYLPRVETDRPENRARSHPRDGATTSDPRQWQRTPGA